MLEGWDSNPFYTMNDQNSHLHSGKTPFGGYERCLQTNEGLLFKILGLITYFSGKEQGEQAE